jgi:Protein of unknown function (DUF3052)
MKSAVGYSGTALAKKLGVSEGCRLLVENQPENYSDLLSPMPSGVVIQSELSETTDVVHIFTDALEVLVRRLSQLRTAIRPDAAIWVSWPKKASKVQTDITEDRIRDAALPLGLVDIKVCAVSDVWSGLKLVIRKELRR